LIYLHFFHVPLKIIHEPWLVGNSDGEADHESHLPPSSSNLFPACVIECKLF
jgi:hypothetical protein